MSRETWTPDTKIWTPYLWTPSEQDNVEPPVNALGSRVTLDLDDLFIPTYEYILAKEGLSIWPEYFAMEREEQLALAPYIGKLVKKYVPEIPPVPGSVEALEDFATHLRHKPDIVTGGSMMAAPEYEDWVARNMRGIPGNIYRTDRHNDDSYPTKYQVFRQLGADYHFDDLGGQRRPIRTHQITVGRTLWTEKYLREGRLLSREVFAIDMAMGVKYVYAHERRKREIQRARIRASQSYTEG